MVISLCALLLCTLLAPDTLTYSLFHRILLIPIEVLQTILIRENQKMDADDKATMDGANRSRVEKAARLEGISFEQVMERRKGFCYLY